MPELLPCPSCAELVRAHACSCPFCGVRHPCSSKRLPAAAMALGLVAGSSGCIIQADYKAADTWDTTTDETTTETTDLDGDGWSPPEDCDDDDPDIHPEAEEVPGDGIDSNCNDDDDT